MLNDGTKIIDNEGFVYHVLSIYPDRRLPYDLSPKYNNMTSRCQYKFKIFKIDSDLVVVFYKDVQFFKVKFKRLIGFPISLSKNHNNEIILFNKLKSDLTIKEAYLSKYEVDTIIKADLEEVSNDFITYVDEAKKKMNSKWRCKHQINTIKNKCLIMRKASINDYQQISDLFDSWVQYKEGIDFKAYTTKMNKIRKNFDKWIDSIYVLDLYGTIISVSIFDFVSKDDVHYLFSYFYNAHHYPASLEEHRSVFVQMSNVHYYYVINLLDELGYTMYRYGSAETDSLYKFKYRYANEVMTYHKLKLNDISFKE